MIAITSTICGTYEITNTDLPPLNVTIEKLNDDKTWDVQETFPIIGGATETRQFVDGIYRFFDSSTSLYHKVPVYCSIESCLKEDISKIICKDNPCDCSEGISQKIYYEFNRKISLVWLFFSLLNSVYVDGFQFTTLSESELDDLFTLSQILNKFTEYCNC